MHDSIYTHFSAFKYSTGKYTAGDRNGNWREWDSNSRDVPVVSVLNVSVSRRYRDVFGTSRSRLDLDREFGKVERLGLISVLMVELLGLDRLGLVT